jgi:hypothetical protein
MDKRKNDFLSAKIAVHLHLYYINQIKFIQLRLQSLDDWNYELYISTRPNARNLSKIRKAFPNAHIIIAPNFGFDIYPFFVFCQQIDLNDYDIVFKIHSKQRVPSDVIINSHNLGGFVWRNLMFDSILGTKKRAKKVIKKLYLSEKNGAIGAKKLYQANQQIYDHIDRNRVLDSFNNLGLELGKEEVIVGSVFACKSNLLQPIKNMNLAPEYFYLNYPKTWNEFPYVMERLVCFIFSAQGNSIKCVRPTLKFVCRHLFWYLSEGGKKLTKLIRLDRVKKILTLYNY